MTEAEFLSKMSIAFKQIESLKGVDSFYDYELAFTGLWREAGRNVLEASISKSLPKKQNKKNTFPRGLVK